MALIKFNNVEYDSDTLSEEAKAQLTMLKFLEQDIQRLGMHMAASQVARNAYLQSLEKLLPK